ncbi:MAG: hypothetical protein ACRD98_00370 [Nitrososphaera sp.]
MLEEERTSLLLKLEKQEISGVAYLQGCLGGLRIVGGMLDTLRILNSNPLEKEENSNPLEK